MKKILLASLIAGTIAVGAQISTVYADTTATQQQRGTISVSTNANADVTPDTVEISLAIKTNDSKSLQKATSENKLISDKVYGALKNMINTQNGDYIKTANYNARPVYVYNSNNKRVLDKYEASNNIIVHTKNIDKAGNMIDKALELGATDVNSINFSLSNYDNKCNSLLEEAAKKAKTRVDIVAKSSGTYVTGVKNINMNCSENSVNRIQYRVMKSAAFGTNAMADEAVAEPSATPIQSGSIKIYANLSAEYFIK